jgi:serine/threonine protein kinase
MIMERFGGKSLFHLMRGSDRLHFIDAIMIGSRVLYNLWLLHENARIVHGDLHSANVMLVPIPGGYEVKLIDFGCASRYRRDLPTTPVHRPGFWYSYMLTSWQMMGFAWAARDDVARAIQLIAQAMNPLNEYRKLENEIEKYGFEPMIRWKERGNWFRSRSVDPIGELPRVSEASKLQMRLNLRTMLYIVRKLGINDVIPYQGLIASLEETARLALPSVPAEPVPVADEAPPVFTGKSTGETEVDSTQANDDGLKSDSA